MRPLAGIVTVLTLLVPGAAAAQEPAPQYTAAQLQHAILATPPACPPDRTREQCYPDQLTRSFTLIAPVAGGRTPPPTPTTPPARTGPSAAQMARRPDAATPRSVRGHTSPAPAPGRQPAIQQDRVVTGAVNILITFALNSSEITPQGRANLTAVARALNLDAVAPLRFEIAGYTDVTGSEEFNRTLSVRRAEAVVAALVAMGVRGSRLVTAGYGPAPLADAEHPTAETNRRVELHRLAP